MADKIGAVLSAGGNTVFAEITSHREFVGSMVPKCFNCGSGSIVAEQYGDGIEVRCLPCCREQELDAVTRTNVLIYVRAKINGRSGYYA